MPTFANHPSERSFVRYASGASLEPIVKARRRDRRDATPSTRTRESRERNYSPPVFKHRDAGDARRDGRRETRRAVSWFGSLRGRGRHVTPSSSTGMSSPVVLAGLALAELHRRAGEPERADAFVDTDESEDDEVVVGRMRTHAEEDDEEADEEAKEDEAEEENSSPRRSETETSATTSGVREEEDEDPGQCRFCFTGSECGSLVAPCACNGSQRFVHKRCLRQWQRVSFQSRGVYETACRVCHAEYSIASSSKGGGRGRRGPFVWFSLRARDRLNEYSRLWVQNALNALLLRKGIPLRRSPSSAGNLALLVAQSEVRIWAGREERRSTSVLPKILRVASVLFTAASSYAKLQLLVGPPRR